MATITYRHFNDDGWFDEDGYSKPTLAYYLLEENGVEFAYRPEFKNYCIAIDVEDGIEEVVIPDEISIAGVGNCIVKECWTAIRNTDKLRKIKKLSIGQNVSNIGFWEYSQLERLTIPEKWKDSIESFVENSPSLHSITIKGSTKEEHIDVGKIKKIENEIEVKHQKEEEEHKKYLEKKEQEEKYKDFDSYTKKMSAFSTWYPMIICAIPYLILAFKQMANIGGFWQFLGWCAVVIGLFIGWAIACIISFYAGYASKDNIIVKMLCPIVAIPLSWFLFMIGLNIMTIISSCSLYGIMDPRFL